MKINKFILGICVALLAVSANAQDTFGTTRTLQVAKPTAVAAATATNTVDLVGFYGRANILLTGYTNTTGSTLTATLTASPDNTNWVAVSYASAVSTAIIYTNMFYGGTNLSVTDTFLLPGTVTTPTASSSGFATPYWAAITWTNTAAISVIGGTVLVGINATDTPRYLRVIWTANDVAYTNTAVVSATLTGYRAF
jgi:hypothetical protein